VGERTAEETQIRSARPYPDDAHDNGRWRGAACTCSRALPRTINIRAGDIRLRRWPDPSSNVYRGGREMRTLGAATRPSSPPTHRSIEESCSPAAALWWRASVNLIARNRHPHPWPGPLLCVGQRLR